MVLSMPICPKRLPILIMYVCGKLLEGSLMGILAIKILFRVKVQPSEMKRVVDPKN